jgi:hypothetical protein
MFAGRFIRSIAVLALAGSLGKKRVPASAVAFPTGAGCSSLC